MRTNLLVAVLLAAAVSVARADLTQSFQNLNSVWEIGSSGLQSSYFGDTKLGQPVTGATTGNLLETLGPARVSYGSGVGPVPSPGGSLGQQFDQGVLGFRTDGHELVFQLATALNPLTGYYYNGYHSWYNQGDLFVDVADDAGLRHFALLNTWGRDSEGSPISLNGGHFSAAQTFHLSGGTGGSSLEGHLVQLSTNNQVTMTGGTGAYDGSNAPTGLDLRTYASGGVDLGSAGLLNATTTYSEHTWYVQTWTFDRTELSAASVFDIGLHAAASCGNDQIGAIYTVPEPATLLLGIFGALLLRKKPHA